MAPVTPAEYAATRPGIAPETLAKLYHRIACWERVLGHGYQESRQADVLKFRKLASAEGLSPRTIESTVDDICRLTGLQPGVRLRCPPPSPDVPTVDRIAAIYQHVDVAVWPRLGGHAKRNHLVPAWCTARREDWWRALIVLAGWWGFRLRDLRRLSWEHVRAAELKAKKTGKTHPLVFRPFIHRHLRAFKGTSGPVFGKLPEKCLRRELRSIAAAAGVEYVPPHGFRRFAVQSWTDVSYQAGCIVQGSGLKVMAHYTDPRRILEKAAPQVDVPRCWLTRKEISDQMRGEAELLEHYRSATPELRKALLTLVRVG